MYKLPYYTRLTMLVDDKYEILIRKIEKLLLLL